MQSINGFDFYTLNFDENGKSADGNEFPAFKQAVSGAVTDAIFMAHGFRNSVSDAMFIYANFLATFRGHLTRPEFEEIGQRKYIVGGVFWPSKSLPESFGSSAEGSVQAADPDASLQITAAEKLAMLKELVPQKGAELDQAAALLPLLEGNADALDKFTALVLSVTEGSQLDVTEGLPSIRAKKGSDMLPKLVPPIILPTSQAVRDGDGDAGSVDLGVDAGTGAGGVQSIGSVFGGILGGVDKFLNLTTWYVMKNRSGVVGLTGVAQAVRDTLAANGSIKIHLVGHSLGGRLMAACAKSLTQTPMVQPDSVTLLEAAFSHYGFSANNGRGAPGFFRDVIAKNVVKGPLIETFSFQDTVVGLAYAVSSRLATDSTQAVGDADDEFGGIGRNGAQRTVESSFQLIKPASTLHAPYIFRTGVVNCIDGSGGLIKDHSDVTNPDVTYAFASAVASTRGSEAIRLSASG
jgi:hypothetical protein